MTRKNDSVTDIDVKILRSVYNMPIEQAAKQLGVCVTVLKRICRRKGIARWPYRKVCKFPKRFPQKNTTNTSLSYIA